MALLLGVVGCAEKAQTMATGVEKKADAPSWQSGANVYVAPGWTPGDRASWEAQMRNRVQSQNDYAVTR
ncbi:MAG: hypothetical protein ABIV63_05090 [Caldimonas sp.]